MTAELPAHHTDDDTFDVVDDAITPRTGMPVHGTSEYLPAIQQTTQT